MLPEKDVVKVVGSKTASVWFPKELSPHELRFRYGLLELDEFLPAGGGTGIPVRGGVSSVCSESELACAAHSDWVGSNTAEKDSRLDSRRWRRLAVGGFVALVVGSPLAVDGMTRLCWSQLFCADCVIPMPVHTDGSGSDITLALLIGFDSVVSSPPSPSRFDAGETTALLLSIVVILVWIIK